MEKDIIKEKIYANWMMYCPYVSKEKKIALLKLDVLPSVCYEASAAKLRAVFKDERCVNAWLNHKNTQKPTNLWELLTKKGIHFTYYGEEEYPVKLLNMADPPFGMYYLGNLPDNSTHAIGIVGARNNSEYGRCLAEHFASKLAVYGVDIISGMALGIDGLAQRACLKAGGRSYGVLGSAVDVIYPRTNTKLYYNLIEQGGVMSEAIPGTAPHSGLFPLRNRIISGLSDAIIVVEARMKSGTFITVDMALEQNKEVFAIPGRCTDDLSIGCNQLIRQGAGVALTPENVLEDMGWIIDKKETIKQNKKTSQKNTTNLSVCVSDVARELIEVMDIDLMTQDEIIGALRTRNCTVSVPLIMQGLLELEMLGIVVRNTGQYALNSTKLEKF